MTSLEKTPSATPGSAEDRKDELFYGALADHFLGFRNGIEFVYYVFVFNMYKNDVKKAIYALVDGSEVIDKYSHYRAVIEDRLASGQYDPRRHVIFCGDSHSMCFEYLGLNGMLGPGVHLFCRIQGASAYGLANEGSQSGALRDMRALLNDKIGDPLVVLNMGEVDCRMTLWGVRETHGVSIDGALKKAISNYRGFIEWLKSRGYSNIAIVAVHLPIWTDETIWTKNAAPREDTLWLTRNFNEQLRQLARELDCYLVDINERIVDPKTGQPNDGFGVIAGEHHLNPEAVGPLLLEQLAEAESYFDAK